MRTMVALLPLIAASVFVSAAELKPVPDQNLPFEQLTPAERAHYGIPQHLTLRALEALQSGKMHVPDHLAKIDLSHVQMGRNRAAENAPAGHGGGGTRPPPSCRQAASGRSLNWSGYVENSNANNMPGRPCLPAWAGASAVTLGEWDAQPLSCPAGSDPSLVCWRSLWPGFDGFDNGVVNQAGILGNTQGFTDSDGNVFPYVSWSECFPAGTIPYTGVNVGDRGMVEVVPGSFTFMNFTTGDYVSVDTGCVTPGASWEIIDEAPSVNGQIAVFPYHPESEFLQISAFAPDGTSYTIADPGARKLILVTIQNGVIVPLNTPETLDPTDFYTVSYGDQP